MRWCLILFAWSALAQSSRDAFEASLQKQRDAVAVQRESGRKQAEMVGPKPLVLPDAGDPPCEPISEAELAPLLAAAATAQKLSPDLLKAVVSRESAFYPCAVSTKGARGLMQLMPDTVAQFSVRDPFDPQQSINAGSQYLKQWVDRYKGDLPKALGAYNAGPSAVDDAKGIPDVPETREYVQAILKSLEKKP